jgi:hypothetical protein
MNIAICTDPAHNEEEIIMSVHAVAMDIFRPKRSINQELNKAPKNPPAWKREFIAPSI